MTLAQIIGLKMPDELENKSKSKCRKIEPAILFLAIAHSTIRRLKTIVETEQQQKKFNQVYFPQPFSSCAFFSISKDMPVSAEDARQLKIKLGTVKRSRKEYDFYVKEEEKQRTLVQKMTEEGSCKHDIKQQQECLNETLTVLPEAKKRLEKYAVELKAYLSDNFDEEDYPTTAESGEEAAESSDKNAAVLLESKVLLEDLAGSDAEFGTLLQ
ncbi:unnamed protein product [Amoebophrya sp. A120]|nr:unnamed protein product [Amoebophrya sp. A120]|eukprot:GSA120T00017767001.1